MKDTEQRIAAKAFSEYWQGKGYEKGESQSFWLSLLRDVLGVSQPEKFITFEEQVRLDHTSFIDGVIPSTHVLIEQKGRGKDLRKPIKQSDGTPLTPFQQAQRYSAVLPYSQRPRWIVTCNFEEFLIYDMEKPNGEPEQIFLKDLEKEYYRLGFLVDTGNENIRREMEVSIQAGNLVGVLYDAILKQYKDPENEETLKSLNKLIVRLVFCLYAEDAGIFGSHTKFHDYINSFPASGMRKALIELFKILDTKTEDRDPYEEEMLLAFPYVNGGLFADENIEIPQMSDEIRDLLLRKASEDFDWSAISPTIFGAVFESTLNPETRRSGGMHYTSIENIHKVIDPLFLDELREELEEIKDIKVTKTRDGKIHQFREKLGSLTFLDPACGSGNFLTETYISLRRLENEAIAIMTDGQMLIDVSDIIKVSIGQFYGIEINDFAVTVAKTALWIAESQMMKETEDIARVNLDFLPLKSYANIVEGNALRIDWESVVPKEKLNYIMGNPPFVGQAMRTKEQANDIQDVFAPSPAGGKLDYVAGWFKKSADIMKNTKIQASFVSSNSICQGESVQLLWEMLLGDGIFINFAHSTFLWTSEAKDKAAVMCVIVGFSYIERKHKLLFVGEQYKVVNHINGYLKDAPDVFIKNRSKSINAGGAKVVQGSPPADDGRLLLSAEERRILLEKYPELEPVIKPFIGSREFINDTSYKRYCFWFVDESPHKYQHIPELIERFNYIREYRLKSPVDRIQKTANKPYLFTQNRQPKTEYLIIPRVSSSNRKYIPIGFLPANVIASDSAVLVYNATLYDFGIICSNVHNAWMRTIAGRLKNDYRYAPSVYYNFPFPIVEENDKVKICKTAQAILNARKLYKDKSLADMYGDAMYLYPELLQAHQENDRAVMKLYGFDIKTTTESTCVAELMKMYQELVKEKG
ncbi:MAG: class I SAM-dependent DNA methyltransferase [Ruminococcaceae bacterium]|nr:class I SAM-dependent DNA methyltransferase [Oscillospiraceae bacterium]